jgi:hypothetical protein
MVLIYEELFDRVFALETTLEVWMQLKEIHMGNKKIGEEKYELLKVELNEFKMNHDEGVEQMYSRMGVLIQSINALNVANLSEQEIIRKILQTLPRPRYNIFKALLFEKDFTTLTITEVVNKIRSHEMFMMEDMDSFTSHSSAKKDLALKACEKIKSKKTNAKPPSSSSESEEKSDSTEAESDDPKLSLLMKRTTRMLSKIGKKGYNYDPKKQKFRASRRNGEGSNRKCYNCGSYDHLSYYCPKPKKRVSSSSKKNDEDDKDAKYYKKRSSKKKSSNKPYHKKKGEHRSLLVNELVTGGETSSESSESEERNKKIAGIAIMDNEEPPLPPPPMCFMENHSKVSDSDCSGSSSSDDDLSPLALKGLLDEYTSMIKKQKSKLKALDETHEKLKLSYDELLVKHNDLSKEHDALVVSNKSLRDDHNKLLDKHNELLIKHDNTTILNKSLESSHMKLMKEHVILEMKYQELELAQEDIGSSGHANAREVTKTNASTSCDDLIDEPKVLLNDVNIASSSKTNHARVKALEEVRSLRSCVNTLAKGEELHNDILYYNARDYGTRGLGSFPNPIKETPRSKELYGCFINEVGSYCQHCKVTGHHTRECPTPTRHLPTLPNNYKSMYNDNHFLLMKKNNGKVAVMFIGAKPKVKPSRSLWIPKALVTHIKGPKLAWVPKSQA